MLKVTCKYSKSFIQQHKQIPNMISFTYFTSQTNLDSNQKITFEHPIN